MDKETKERKMVNGKERERTIGITGKRRKGWSEIKLNRRGREKRERGGARESY